MFSYPGNGASSQKTGMKLPILSLLLSLTWTIESCSVEGGWEATPYTHQWSAAAQVVYGTADGIFSCDPNQNQDMQHYHAKDEALFNASRDSCDSEVAVLVLFRNLTFLKGNVSDCDVIVVAGFEGTPACSVDPPGSGVSGTMFLCTAAPSSGVCVGRLNDKGNIHLGFDRGEVTAPTNHLCPQDGTCRDVGQCSNIRTSGSHWTSGLLSLLLPLLWHAL